MGSNRFCIEEARQPVVMLGETGAAVKIALCGKYPFAECNHVVTGHGDAMERAEHIEQGLEGFRLIQNREGDKQAHTGGVNGCRGNLQIARQFDLTFGFERINIAADFKDVGGNRIAGGVMGV